MSSFIRCSSKKKRDYIPSVGRWAAEDPLGFWGGTTNFYAYATSDPVNFGGADDFLKGSYKGRMTLRVFAISDGGQPQSDDDSYPPGWDTGRGFTPGVYKGGGGGSGSGGGKGSKGKKEKKGKKGKKKGAKTSNRILNMTTKQLQKKYMKHAADFGLTGNWNKAAASKFSSAINKHINLHGVKIIQGTYKNQPAIHYLNPKTGLNVISHPNGQFWSGWKLGSQQLQGVLKSGMLW